jgi:hypothetical protein
MENKNPHIGSSLDNLLKEEGFLAEARATALKEALAYQGKKKRRLWKWWKRVAITMGIVGLVGISWSSSLWYQYQRTLPRHPDPVAGRIYPLNVHGIVVYQTRDERNWLDEIDYSSIAVFAAGGLMGAIYQKKFGRPPIPPTVGPSWTSKH